MPSSSAEDRIEIWGCRSQDLVLSPGLFPRSLMALRPCAAQGQESGNPPFWATQ